MQEVFVKIKERIEDKIVTTWACDYIGGKKDAFYEAIEIVDQVAKEFADDTNVGHKNGWITCSKDMPKENEDVLITTKTTGKVYKGTYTKRYGFSMREGLMCDSGFISASEVIAWQPSPEPYKEKEND